MSYKTFFMFAAGLSRPVVAPKGTLASITAHVEDIERTLGLKRTRYKDNPAHWDSFDPAYRAGFPDVPDKELCEAVQAHNSWVRRFHAKLARWADAPPADGETITPETATEFWHALQMLSVRPERWTTDYYRARMEVFYEVMRGRETEGISFNARALTPKQGAAVIALFSDYLDPAELCLDVPDGHDFLASSNDGGYAWCDKCFKPKTYEDGAECRRRGCPLVERAA